MALAHLGHLFNFTFFKAWCERPRLASLLDLRLAGTDIDYQTQSSNVKTQKLTMTSGLQVILIIFLL